MTTKTLDFTALSVADPATPPTGYTQPSGSNNSKIFNTGTKEWVSTGTQSIWYDNTTLTGTVISSTVKIGTATISSSGPCIVDSSGNGVMIITNTSASSFRPYLVVNSQLSGSPLVTALNIPAVTNQLVKLERNTSTNLYTMYVNGSSVGTFTSATYNPLFAGAVSRNGYARELTSEYTPAQTVTSINGSSPITSSQSAVAAVTTGFTGLPATITTNAAGVTCGSISGTTNAPTWVQTVRTDGAVFPKDGTVVTYTFVNGAETASGTQTIIKDTDQTKVVVASPINDDITCLFGAIFAATGRSASNGDEVYHAIPPAMLTNGVDTILPADAIAADGTMQFYNAGAFDCWIWTNATGVNYFYRVTITEGGAVIINGGLTSSGLTSVGLTSAGLTSSGI